MSLFKHKDFKKMVELGLTEAEIDELIKIGSVYDDRRPKEQQKVLEQYRQLIENFNPQRVTWSSLMEKDDSIHDKPLSAIASPVELRITRKAFSACGDSKKRILRDLRKRVAFAKFEDVTQQGYGIAVTPETLVWFFEAEEFLKIVKDYPWLLDANLGEKEVEDDSYFSPMWRKP